MKSYVWRDFIRGWPVNSRLIGPIDKINCKLISFNLRPHLGLIGCCQRTVNLRLIGSGLKSVNLRLIGCGCWFVTLPDACHLEVDLFWLQAGQFVVDWFRPEAGLLAGLNIEDITNHLKKQIRRSLLETSSGHGYARSCM